MAHRHVEYQRSRGGSKKHVLSVVEGKDANCVVYPEGDHLLSGSS